jgi:pyrroline-5-carboxylate reductase
MELIIVGSGKMAIAILEGARKSFDVTVVARDKWALEKIEKRYKVKVAKLSSFNMHNKNILLAVKPYALKSVASNLIGRANLVLSVLAGTNIQTLKNTIKSKHYIRVMPNLASAYKKSMTTVTGDENFKDVAMNISKSLGKVLWVNSEKELDIATAVAGSGPAFLALVAEALSDGAVKEGLKREDANFLVQGLFEGFVPLLKDNHPALLKDAVMSPGGTTAAGYSALEEGKTRDSFIKAITRAYERTLK